MENELTQVVEDAMLATMWHVLKITLLVLFTAGFFGYLSYHAFSTWGLWEDKKEEEI